jgi:hypothetical protein
MKTLSTPSEDNLRCRKFYRDRCSAGLCPRCSQPADPGSVLCKEHRARSIRLGQERKEKIAAYKRTIRHIENARKRTPEYRLKRNANRRLRKRTDPAWAMADRLRKRIGRAIRDNAGRGAKKAHKTAEYIGCTVPDLMRHIESKFLPGMAWNNRNLWHLDHIKPCTAYNLLDPEQQRACFHYTNLQPLWAKDNMRKHAKF